MGKLLDVNSPLMQTLGKIADLMWLNILVIICSIPIFTMGTALTSAHYVALKMHRNEESYISREFFKAFKANFKQSTLIWLFVLFITVILVIDFYLMRNYELLNIPQFLQIIIMAAAILFLFMVVWVFPVQAKFVNTVPKTIKNAFALSMIQFPKTILMVLMYIVPWVCLFFTLQIVPVVFLFGISLPIFGSAVLYNKMFKKLEARILEKEEEANGPKEETVEDDSEKIFSDKPMFEEDKEDR